VEGWKVRSRGVREEGEMGLMEVVKERIGRKNRGEEVRGGGGGCGGTWSGLQGERVGGGGGVVV